MVPLYKVYMPDNIDVAVNKALKSGFLSYGEHTKLFETKLKDYINNNLCLTTSYNPVYFALKAFGIGFNDEVIASPMMCLASSQPVIELGAKIIWADIEHKTGSLNPDDVVKKITSNTKAIIHFHWGGQLGYIDEILKIGKKYGIYILEDATESFGAKINNLYLGNHGADATVFAFTPVRVPNTIDGGAVFFSHLQEYEKGCLIRDYGINRPIFRDNNGEIDPKCDIKENGAGMLINNISGLIGCYQMEHVAELIKKHQTNAKNWQKELANIPDIEPLTLPDKGKSIYWVYTILSENRDFWLQKFRNNGLYASKMHLRNDLYSIFGQQKTVLAGVDEFAAKELNIPCGWWVNDEDCHKI